MPHPQTLEATEGTIAAGAGRATGAAVPAPYDVRLRRELTHRRLAVSLLRRALRNLTLHALDALLVVGVLYALASLRGEAAQVRPLVPAVAAIFLLSLNALAAYRAGDARRDAGRLGWGVLLAVTILGCLSVLPPRLPLNADLLVLMGAGSFVALGAGRWVADQVVRQAYVRGIGLRRTLVVGSLDDAGRALRELRDEHNIDQRVVGRVAPDDAPDPAALGGIGAIDRLLDRTDVQEVLVASALGAEALKRVSSACFDRGVSVFVVPSVVGSPDCWSEPMRVGSCPLLRLHPARFEMPALAIKRAMDVALASLALLLLSPLIALIALAIRADSRGPVFFRQERVGLGGRRFRMWKFRSMEADAEEQEERLAHLNIYGSGTFKLRDDPRITRMGRVLRRTSLDELPQLLNVIRGEMSLVGPRPALVGDLRRYEPHHFERFAVVPGITGPWQVGGRNLIQDFEKILQMERSYIANWSLLLDAKILLKTVKVVVTGEGAY